jgi:ureidoglycolate lyase
MSGVTLRPVPITTERFAPYGDVIHAAPATVQAMNDARFERFDDLARVDVDETEGGRVAISIARSKTPTTLPHRFDMVERHPLGSQAFIPLAPFSFVVVVAPAGESVDIGDLRAFVTNGSQGINYHKGVWHMPLIATEGRQTFLVIDRVPGENNCEQVVFGESVVLEVP